MEMTKEIIKKINNGDGISDEELKCAMKFYTDIHKKLHLFGERYTVVKEDIYRVLTRLEDIEYWRKHK